MQSYRGKKLTFGKPLICSPTQKWERRIEEGGEEGGVKREKRKSEQEEERAFTVRGKQP